MGIETSEESRYQDTTIDTIAEGAVPEVFQEHLKRVLGNIDDINTPAKAKRQITIEVIFAPDASRTAVEVAVNVKSKLAGTHKAEGTIFITRDAKGALRALDQNVNQASLFKA